MNANELKRRRKQNLLFASVLAPVFFLGGWAVWHKAREKIAAAVYAGSRHSIVEPVGCRWALARCGHALFEDLASNRYSEGASRDVVAGDHPPPANEKIGPFEVFRYDRPDDLRYGGAVLCFENGRFIAADFCGGPYNCIITSSVPIFDGRHVYDLRSKIWAKESAVHECCMSIGGGITINHPDVLRMLRTTEPTD